MIKTTSAILKELKDYSNPKTKLARLVSKGKYIRIIRGLYEDDPKTDPFFLSNAIYGPSYISSESALSYYSLIPERVVAITCATFGKNKRKIYETPFGRYIYQDVPSDAFPLGVITIIENGRSFQIATKEKALCDEVYAKPPISNIKEMAELVFEDLRIEEEDFLEFDYAEIKKIAENYHSTNVNKLTALLKRYKNRYSHLKTGKKSYL